MMQRFCRALPVEMWLIDYAEFAAYRCNTQVFINNLVAAS